MSDPVGNKCDYVAKVKSLSTMSVSADRMIVAAEGVSFIEDGEVILHCSHANLEYSGLKGAFEVTGNRL
jgi:hypothetical protein